MLERFPASQFIQMVLESLNMSPSELSRLSGVSKKVISDILNNKCGYSTKIDYKLAPILGFDVGILCQIESKYLEYKNRSYPSYNNIYESNWCFRKEEKINNDKALQLLKKADKIIYENDISNTDDAKKDVSVKNFLFNDLSKSLTSSHNLRHDLSDLFEILPDNIKLIKFNGVNIRGMCKKYNNTHYICINSSMNNTIQKFYKTLIHELLHFFDDNFFEQYDIKISNDNESEEQERVIDNIAHDIMLNNKKYILDKITMNNQLQVKSISEKLDINFHMLKGYFDYRNKNFKLTKADNVDYRGDYWWEIK